MLREKMFVEYPIATSLEQAVQWMKAGNQCWQEISDDWPECGGFDEVSDLYENFPDGIDETDNVHLVTKVSEEAPPFKVGDWVVALEELIYCCGQSVNDKIDRLTVNKVDGIRIDEDGGQRLFFADHADRYGPWDADHFVFNVCSD